MVWDKTKPAGSTPLKTSDDDIRANNTAIEAALAQDHDFISGSTQTGKHTRTTFKAVLSAKPSLSAGEAALYTKTLNGKAELFYEDSDGSEFLAMVPVGSIIPFIPGYFTGAANAGYTFQLGSANTVAAINTLLNAYGWYVCDGAVLNLATSPIFNGSGRYLPNLTDDRFLMGDTVAGGVGGANTNDLSHTHATGNFTLTSSHMPAHTHTFTTDAGGSHAHTVPNAASGETPMRGLEAGYYSASTTNTGIGGSHTHEGTTNSRGSGASHNHGATGSGGSETQENKPAYLSCLYIMRVQ